MKAIMIALVGLSLSASDSAADGYNTSEENV